MNLRGKITLCSRIVLNKKNQEVIKSRIVTTSKCPRWFSKVTDTSLFTGATGPQGATGPTGPQGPAAINNLTVLTNILIRSTSINFDTSAYKLFDVGTFEKLSDDTKIKVTTSTAVNVGNDSDNDDGACSLFFLVNNQMLGGTNLPVFSAFNQGIATAFNNGANNSNQISQINMMGIVEGLPAGEHTLSVGFSGYSITSGRFKHLGFQNDFYIEEF